MFYGFVVTQEQEILLIGDKFSDRPVDELISIEIKGAHNHEDSAYFNFSIRMLKYVAGTLNPVLLLLQQLPKFHAQDFLWEF